MQDQVEVSWDRERLLEALDAFRRGVADAPLLRKWKETGPTRREAGQDQKISFVPSTDEVDRHGDVISADGWNLESYRNNPVFLWAHDYTRPVIGRALETWTDSHRLMARVEFAPTPFAQEVAMLYEAGYQRGVSVGFKPLRYEERRHEKTGAILGIRFLEQELLEASAVPVPANRNALRKALSAAPRVGEYLRRANPGSSAFEATWPTLLAQVDELGKLVEEMAETLASLEFSDDIGHERSSLKELLSVLKGAQL